MYTTIVNKKNKERVVDKDGNVLRVAALCTIECKNETELLLITSKNSHEKWIVPGGGVDQDECYEDAALREAYEESGAICDNVEYLGAVTDPIKMKCTHVFRLNVIELTDDWEESKLHKRLRQWFSIPDAYKALANYRTEQIAYLDLLR